MAKMDRPDMNDQLGNDQQDTTNKSLQDLIIHDNIKQTNNQRRRLQNNTKRLSKRALKKKKKSKPSFHLHDAFDDLQKEREQSSNQLDDLSNSSDSLFDQLQKDNMQDDLKNYDKEKNLENLIQNKSEQKKSKLKNKIHKKKKKHKSVLTSGQKKKASFIGKLILPIIIVINLCGAMTVCLMNMLMLHQVEIVATLASPKYYAELGARHLLGGARKLTDIPQDLIGSEPDLNTDYQHNDLMNKNSPLNKATNNAHIGNIGDGNINNQLPTLIKVCKAVGKYAGIDPAIIFGQMNAEQGIASGHVNATAWNLHNITGIMYAGQPGATASSTRLRDSGRPMAKFKDWNAYAQAYAKNLTSVFPKTRGAKTASQYMDGLINDKGQVYYAASIAAAHQVRPSYQANIEAGIKKYHELVSKGYGGGPIGWGAGGGLRQKVISLAETRVKAKIPYVYGGTNWTSGMDCSGLVMNCMHKAGISDFPRTSGAQYQYLMKKGCKREAVNQAKPGDLGFEGDNGSEHVCIYKGDNTVIEEPEPGTPCHERQVYSGLYFVDCSKLYGSGGGNTSDSSKHGKHGKDSSDGDSNSDNSGVSSNGAYESGGDTDYLNYAGYRTRRMLYYYNGRNATEQLHSALSDGTASGHKSSSKSSSSESKNDGKFPYNPDADELKIINAESSGNPHAVNGQYYGIFQTTAANYERYCADLKNADWKNNKGVQLYCMRRYEKERYGGYANNDFSKPDKATTARAVADRMAKGWW